MDIYADDSRPVILLDLNYTFVDNSRQTHMPGRPDVDNEQYRTWLIPLFEQMDAIVVMVTVRHERYREKTLARIERLTGWQPHQVYFKPPHLSKMTPPDHKHRVVVEHVWPEFGRTRTYLALESNSDTRARYAQLGIKAQRVAKQPDLWSALPEPAPLLPMTVEGNKQDGLIVLLDLNYTLVANSAETFHMVSPNIAEETYRQWLIDLISDKTVILTTSRLATMKDKTLSRIHDLTGWQPDRVYFKPYRHRFMKAHIFKGRIAREAILPTYGTSRPYLALESNHQTRDQYQMLGIPALAVPKESQWMALPDGAYLQPNPFL